MNENAHEFWDKYSRDDWEASNGAPVAAFVLARYEKEKGFVRLAERACLATGADFSKFSTAAGVAIKNAIMDDKSREAVQQSHTQAPAEMLLINLADIEPEPVDWLWYPYFPKGKITTVQGDPGSGKTFIMSKIAAFVSTGEPFPGDLQGARTPGTVIYQNGEDGIADTIVPRLIACKADRNRVFMISEEHKALTLSNLAVIEAAFKECKPVLLVIDPIQQFLGADIDMHRANEVRPVLTGLSRLCSEYGTACIIVMHMNKGEAKVMYRALGSIDFAAIARSQLLIGRDRNNPGENLIVHTKSSLAPYGSSLSFKIRGAEGLDFLGESLATADDILKEAPSVKSDSALAEAMELVRQEVSLQPVWSTEMEEKAIERGIAIRTLNRAKQTLKDSGEIQMAKAPGLQRWYIKKRGTEITFADTAPGYAKLEDRQTKLPNL